MTPVEVDTDLLSRGFRPEPRVEDEPRTYLPESGLGREYLPWA